MDSGLKTAGMTERKDGKINGELDGT